MRDYEMQCGPHQKQVEPTIWGILVGGLFVGGLSRARWSTQFSIVYISASGEAWYKVSKEYVTPEPLTPGFGILPYSTISPPSSRHFFLFCQIINLYIDTLAQNGPG
jgi:hypothetical protein